MTRRAARGRVPKTSAHRILPESKRTQRRERTDYGRALNACWSTTPAQGNRLGRERRSARMREIDESDDNGSVDCADGWRER